MLNKSEFWFRRYNIKKRISIIRSKKFNLPKKLPVGGGLDWDVVIVDATEIVVQRPKKTEEKL